MIRRARPRRPMEFSVRGKNKHIVDAAVAAAHQTVRIEFPLFVAMGTEPVAGIVVPLTFSYLSVL